MRTAITFRSRARCWVNSRSRAVRSPPRARSSSLSTWAFWPGMMRSSPLELILPDTEKSNGPDLGSGRSRVPTGHAQITCENSPKERFSGRTDRARGQGRKWNDEQVALSFEERACSTGRGAGGRNTTAAVFPVSVAKREDRSGWCFDWLEKLEKAGGRNATGFVVVYLFPGRSCERTCDRQAD